MKRLQNQIAESRKTLPITILYGVGVWLMAGLVQHHWWFQFLCFFASVYTMIHLNNVNLLIRIYSRAVSVSYLMLGCATVWLFPSVSGAILQCGTALMLFLLFACYQDTGATGKTFYVFLLISVMCLTDPHYLLLIPAVYLLMATTVYALSIRTFLASLIGLITPYWFYTGWQLFLHPDQPAMALAYLTRLSEMQWLPLHTDLTLSQLLYLLLVAVLFVVGTIHFWLTSYMDKIRVRNIYASLNLLAVYTLILIAVQPHQYNTFIPVLTLSASPVIAHFMALTRTRLSNLFFIVALCAVLLLTAYNLWI